MFALQPLPVRHSRRRLSEFKDIKLTWYGFTSAANDGKRKIFVNPFMPIYRLINGNDDPLRYHYYTYPWENATIRNVANLTGFLGFVVLSLGIGSHSWRDMLILWALSFFETEITQMKKRGYCSFGISGINGWLGGYLICQFLFKWNWSTVLGVHLLVDYFVAWYTQALVHHGVHFLTLLKGFAANFAIKLILPRPKPTMGGWPTYMAVAYLLFAAVKMFFAHRWMENNKEAVKEMYPQPEDYTDRRFEKADLLHDKIMSETY